ncbi:hypothetical protein JKF63_00829 [Porcisia hertigi]|uniref:Adiponectin receptor protein 1 n=1 Tax=Porcisia hertigi TaxID=2761500 RepID=A0A836GZ08_9TRYP|nr:hypothetical protein JKF63_00829 [Porcisia hertigi]
MSWRATNITLEDDAPRWSSLELKEDSRVLADREENDELTLGDLMRECPSSAPFLSVDGNRRHPTRSSVQQHHSLESSECAHATLPSYSSSETVATPPFIPTERHHNFFMDDVDSQHGRHADSSSETRRGLDSAPSYPVPFDTVMSHRETRIAIVPVSPAETQHITDVSPAASPSAKYSVAAQSGETPHPKGQAVTDGKTQPHNGGSHKPHFPLVAKAPPFDAMRSQQWNLLSMGLDRELPLYKFEEIPQWQKYNQYIRGGYRAFYSARMCFKSLFGWHNETINVYSHMLTFVIFLVFTVLLYTTVLNKVITAPSLGATKQVYGFFCFGSLICMLNSTLYHLFNSHCSCRVMTAMGRLDFIGITALIVSSFLPPLYVMFHCQPVVRTVYITAISILGMAGIIGPWTDAFHRHVWVRLSVFLGVGFSGVIPIIHFTIIFPINAASMSTVLGVFLMVLLYSSGVFFYVTKFPESRYAGHFDCWLSSHQMWHLFVSMAAFVHYFNCISMYQLWKVSDGMCG